MHSRIGCICLIFLHYVFFKCLHKLLGSENAKSRWLHLFGFSPLCIFKCVLKLLEREDAKSHWLHLLDFSPLCLFIWDFRELGSVQCKVALVEFVWFFSAVRFQMCLQMACPNWCKAALVHLFGFSPLWVFKCLLKLTARSFQNNRVFLGIG